MIIRVIPLIVFFIFRDFTFSVIQSRNKLIFLMCFSLLFGMCSEYWLQSLDFVGLPNFGVYFTEQVDSGSLNPFNKYIFLIIAKPFFNCGTLT